MSNTHISFHRVVSADVRAVILKTQTHLVQLTFRDDAGQTLALDVYAADAGPILAALAKCDDAALTNAYAEGRKDEREAIAPPQEAA